MRLSSSTRGVSWGCGLGFKVQGLRSKVKGNRLEVKDQG